MSQSMNGLNAISVHRPLYINSDEVTQTPALPMPSLANAGNVSIDITMVKPKTRAKRGQATDRHSIAERVSLDFGAVVHCVYVYYLEIRWLL